MKPISRNTMLVHARAVEAQALKLVPNELTTEAFHQKYSRTVFEQLSEADYTMAQRFRKAPEPLTFFEVGRHLHQQGGLTAFLLMAEGLYDPHEIVSLLSLKQSMYGPMNLQKYGIFGVLIRVSDKISRLATLADNINTHVESYRDTLIDITGYCILGLSLITDGDA